MPFLPPWSKHTCKGRHSLESWNKSSLRNAWSSFSRAGSPGGLSGYSNRAGTLRLHHSPRTREVIVKLFLMLMGAIMSLAQEVSQALQTSLGLVSLRYRCKLFKIHGPFAQVYAHHLFHVHVCVCRVLSPSS